MTTTETFEIKVPSVWDDHLECPYLVETMSEWERREVTQAWRDAIQQHAYVAHAAQQSVAKLWGGDIRERPHDGFGGSNPTSYARSAEMITQRLMTLCTAHQHRIALAERDTQ